MTTVTATGTVNVEFLYLDLDTCQRCGGTDENLTNAISAARPALSGAGLDLVVTRTLVEDAQHAAELGFVSSPTIRVDGIDIAGELRESICGDCGDLCGTDTMCRVWKYQGEEYTAAPTGLIIEGIMGSAFDRAPLGAQETPGGVPDNLTRFFKGKQDKIDTESSDSGACGCGTECC